MIVNKKPLFNEDIIAWRYGPVIEEVYRYYKKYINLPIVDKQDQPWVKTEISQKDKLLINEIVDAKQYLSTVGLVDITRQEDPWKKCYKEKESRVISLYIIKEYFLQYPYKPFESR